MEGRYLVVERWHVYPARSVKTCQQWLIIEDRVVPLDEAVIGQLALFYERGYRSMSLRARVLLFPALTTSSNVFMHRFRTAG